MKGVYIQDRSPYYWIRYYDKQEKKPKSLNTKIEVTNADRRKWEAAKGTGERAKLEGTYELREQVRSFRIGLAERSIYIQTGVKIKRRKKLSEGIQLFMIDKPLLKTQSRTSYRNVVNRFIEGIGHDKYINEYQSRDYYNFVEWLKDKGYKEASKSSFTKHLSVIWNYFVKKEYANENIIQIIQAPQGIPEPIPQKDLKYILDFYKRKIKLFNDKKISFTESEIKQQSDFVHLMYYTGFRQSTILDLDWSRVHMRERLMIANNIKGSKIFAFPIHKKLEKLLKDMRPENEGKLFNYKSTDSLSFWDRDLIKMVEQKKIRKKYQMYQLRDTFASSSALSGMDMSIVQDLLNHSDIKVTKKHYAIVDANHSIALLDHVKFL